MVATKNPRQPPIIAAVIDFVDGLTLGTLGLYQRGLAGGAAVIKSRNVE